jgi:endonuclease YncB( thermonuclease family)
MNYFNGKVISVLDGDTIIILSKNHVQLKIRLEGIDCPEHNQAFGEKAKYTTKTLCYHKEVRIEKTGEDRYGRTLAFVYVDTICVNKELLRQGMAWQYKKYNHDPEYAALENEARVNKIGIWSQPNPVPPWEFRSR